MRFPKHAILIILLGKTKINVCNRGVALSLYVPQWQATCPRYSQSDMTVNKMHTVGEYDGPEMAEQPTITFTSNHSKHCYDDY